MNIRIILFTLLILAGLLFSACGSIPTNIPIPTGLPNIPTGLPDINIPTINPPNIETVVATSPATSTGGDITPTPEPPIPVTGNETSGQTMLLYGLLALFAVIVLFGLYTMLGRPDRPPDDGSQN